MKKILLLILISLLPLAALLPSGLPITHDGADHVARIANFYLALEEGIIVPRWAQFLNWGYGHPILMFLYPLSSYTASFFHYLGFSYIDSLKIIFGLGFVASGITMYLWAREQFDDKVGFACALLYLFAPYRFVDLYVRGAIGEHMAFIFPPLVMYFIFKFFKERNAVKEYLFLCGISGSFALLLLSHNAISLMFVPVFILYILFLFLTKRQIRKVIYVLSFLMLGILLSGFFTFPAFFEGKYTLRDIVTGNEYKTRFVDNPLKFVFGKWNYGITGQFTVQLGIAQLVGLLLFLFLIIKKKIEREKRILLVGFLSLLILSIIVQLPFANFLYEMITTLKKFQFPWRFLSLSLFAIAILAASSLYLFKKEHRRWVIMAYVTLLLITTFPFWRAKGYISSPDVSYHQIYKGTTDTGESAPIWSVRFMEKSAKAPVEVISGEATITQIQRTSTIHKYIINVETDNSRIRENTLYFPGWNVFVDGMPVEIEFQDPSERGLITFYVSKGKHAVTVEFVDTKLRQVSNSVSLVTFVMIVVIGIFIVYKKNEK